MDDLNEQLEEACYQRDSYKAQLGQTKTHEQGLVRELDVQKRIAKELRSKDVENEMTRESMARSCHALIDFVKVSERFRKQFSE